MEDQVLEQNREGLEQLIRSVHAVVDSARGNDFCRFDLANQAKCLSRKLFSLGNLEFSWGYSKAVDYIQQSSDSPEYSI